MSKSVSSSDLPGPASLADLSAPDLARVCQGLDLLASSRQRAARAEKISEIALIHENESRICRDLSSSIRSFIL